MTLPANWSQPALDYFEKRAIDPELAAELGVREAAGAIVFPVSRSDGSTFERRRSLNGGAPKVTQPKGQSLCPWWPAGRPDASELVLVCEGESDGLAALSALPHTPLMAGLRDLPVLAIPGTGYPAALLAQELSDLGVRQALLATDADDAGRRFAERASTELRSAGVQPAVVDLPDGSDLAGQLAQLGSPADRGEWLANALVDAGWAADPLPSIEAEAVRRAAPPGTAGRRLITRVASSIQPEATRWLWAGRVPLGAVTLLAGRQGLGKSTLTCELAARVSRGQLDLAGPAAVLLVSFEDHAARTIRPRLSAAGADLSRVHLIDAERDGLADLVSLPGDVEGIAEAARRHGARLLIVDPLVASLASGEINAHRDQDVRRALAPLSQLAEDADLAVLCAIHFNKAAGTDVLARISGSTGFTAAARSVLAFGADPADSDGERGPRRVLAHSKSNLSPLAPSLAYRLMPTIVEAADGSAIEQARLVSHGECDAVASELLDSHAGANRSDLDDAIEWLTDALHPPGTWRSSRDLKGEAKLASYSERTLKRAKQQLDVQDRSGGFPRRTEWSLPSVGPRPACPAGPHNRGPTVENPAPKPVGERTAPQLGQDPVLGPTERVCGSATPAEEAEAERIAAKLERWENTP